MQMLLSTPFCHTILSPMLPWPCQIVRCNGSAPAGQSCIAGSHEATLNCHVRWPSFVVVMYTDLCKRRVHSGAYTYPSPDYAHDGRSGSVYMCLASSQQHCEHGCFSHEMRCHMQRHQRQVASRMLIPACKGSHGLLAHETMPISDRSLAVLPSQASGY